MAVIDHLVLAAPDLDAGVDLVASIVGVRAAPGGAHDGLGTHNALAAFDEGTYLEIIGIDPTQPEPAHPRAFGLRPDGDIRLVTYAVRPTDGETLDDLADALRSAGAEIGPAIAMQRTRPDGVTIHWRLTLPVTGNEPAVPFLIDWGDTPHPADGLPLLGPLHGLHGGVADAGLADALCSLDPRLHIAADAAASLHAELDREVLLR